MVEDEDEDVVLGDLIVKKEMFEEIKIEISSQGELEELKIIGVVRTDGNKRIIKVTNVLIVARRDITQEIAGRRKLKEMSQHLLRMNTLEKKIGISTLLSLWKKKTLLMHEGKAQQKNMHLLLYVRSQSTTRMIGSLIQAVPII